MINPLVDLIVMGSLCTGLIWYGIEIYKSLIKITEN